MYSHIVMANLDLLFRSISYIEAHLDCDLQTESIAKACFTSKSGLEKTFRMSHFSIQDYILRRRMMKAAQMIVQQPQMRLIDIAFQYGYSSHESFTRSFNSVWNCNPSKFKENYVQNGQTFDFEDKKIPLSLYAVITKINVESMKYSELFGALEQVIDREKIKMKK